MSLYAPDAFEELVGARAWRLVRGRLWSLYRPVAWHPDRPVKAECLSAQPTDRFTLQHTPAHDAPSMRCRCGLYAAFWPPQEPSPDPNTCSSLTGVLGLPEALEGDVVLGEVAGWGTTELYTRGFRSEYAVVRAIYATHDLAGEVADLYDVPLVSV